MSMAEQTIEKITSSLWAASLWEALEIAQTKGEFAYWLLNRSALPTGWLNNYASNQPWVDLLRGDGFIVNADTPVLVNVQQDSRKFQAFVDIVQRDARYANTVAFLITPMDIAAFQKTLCLRARIELPQKLEVVLRFFDTRTLPLLPTLFTPEQYALFLKDISAWHYLDRYGELQSLPMPDTQPAEILGRVNSRCVLNVEQEALLIEDGITDAVIDYLITQGLGGLHNMLPPEQFDTVSPLVNQARQQGKHDHAEVFEFVAGALQEPVT